MPTEAEIFENFNKTDIESILKSSNREIICLWSGGCDSTLVLFELLNKLKSINDNRVVKAYSFAHEQLGSVKMLWEKQKRDTFLLWLDQNGYTNKIQHTHISLPGYQMNQAGIIQPALWLTNIIPLTWPESIIFGGYHEGDCFWNYDVMANWLKIASGMITMLNKKVEFYMPLRFFNKKGIIAELKRYEIYEYTWWCEIPGNNGKCGFCAPCQLHEMSLDYYNKQFKIENSPDQKENYEI